MSNMCCPTIITCPILNQRHFQVAIYSHPRSEPHSWKSPTFPYPSSSTTFVSRVFFLILPGRFLSNRADTRRSPREHSAGSVCTPETPWEWPLQTVVVRGYSCGTWLARRPWWLGVLWSVHKPVPHTHTHTRAAVFALWCLWCVCVCGQHSQPVGAG